MPNKETKDIYVAAAELAKSTIQAGADGKLDFSDAQFFIDDFDEISEATKDANNAPSEWATMSQAEKEEIFEAVNQRLDGHIEDEQDQNDFIDFAKGLQSAINLISRKRLKKEEEGNARPDKEE